MDEAIPQYLMNCEKIHLKYIAIQQQIFCEIFGM